jgi:hypothetical protein
MKNQPFAGNGFVEETIMPKFLRFTNVYIHKLTAQLIAELLPAAVNKRSLFINDIDPELTVHTDENMLAYVLWNMLNCALNSTEKKCIHIDVEMHEQGVIILLKDAGAYFYRNISSNYRRVQYVAERLGGTIHVDNKQCDETTVTIILYNNSHAA